MHKHLTEEHLKEMLKWARVTNLLTSDLVRKNVVELIEELIETKQQLDMKSRDA